MADGHFPTLISKDISANLIGNPIFVQISDGVEIAQIDPAGNLAIDISVQTLEAVAVSKNQLTNTELNPIFVEIVESSLSTIEVHDYDTAVSVVGDGSSDHDYTVVGTTFLLQKIVMSSSGAAKFEVQTGPIASLVTVAVVFIPKRGGTECLDITKVPREVPDTLTGTVRVIRTNREGSSQDIYTTIIGNDIP